jgi:arylformamidase
MGIVGEMREFLRSLWHRTGVHPLVAGHSAGGYLTAALVATDWGEIEGVPSDLVRAGCSISGVFDLAPLVGTSINEVVGLDREAARAASPMFWPHPPPGRTFVAAVGELESEEFLRQSREIAGAWTRAGLGAEPLVIPGTNHFTIVDELVKPDSRLFGRIVELAHKARDDAR